MISQSTMQSLSLGYAYRALGAIIVLSVMIPIFSIYSFNFLTFNNIVNVGLQSSILLLIALPMTFVILSEGLDLSPGAVLSLCGVVLALFLVEGHSLLVATCVAVAIGVIFGLANGLLISVLGMPPFVVTLGTSGMAYGLALVLADGNAVSGLGNEIVAFNKAKILNIPMLIYIAISCYFVFHIILYHTKFGRYVFAIGGNIQALRYSGINTKLVHTVIYVLMGACSGFAALCMIGRTNAGHPGIALGMEFDAIAAVVLGGTSFERGDGWLLGTVLGVLAIGILRNGLNLLAIDTSVQGILIGGLVLAVLLLDKYAKGWEK